MTRRHAQVLCSVGAASLVCLLPMVGFGIPSAVGPAAVGGGAARTEGDRHEASRHPLAIDAERTFFRALNHEPAAREGATRALAAAYVASPDDDGTALWLGMAHLWAVAESPADDPGDTIERLVLAEHFLRRAAALRPWDGRIPSWLNNAAAHRRRLERDRAGEGEEVAMLRRAFAADPCFHGVGLGIVLFDHGTATAEFREGLEAMRAGLACAGDDPSGQNGPRWLHNVEGFLLALADYELKAGETRRAEVMLMTALSREGAETWPFRPLAEERLDTAAERSALFRNADPADDPPYILSRHSGVSCVVCHQSGR